MGITLRGLVVAVFWIGAVVHGQFANNPHCPSNHRCSVYCDFHGTCSTNGQCVCDEGWSGVNCTIKQCKCVHGDCRTIDGVTQCVCNSGWTGRLCDKLFARRYYSKPICTLDGHCVCPPHSDLCQHGESPDLVPSLQRFRPYVEWQTFPECHCAVDAGCTKPGHRKLLRFPMRTDNIGTADLLIGDPGDYLDKYVWHICHNHPHFDHFSEFTLRHKILTNMTAHGFKSGSTVVDSYRWDRGTPFNAVRQYNEKHQGIQAGWADIYPASLDCQWIDVTDLPLGDYVLELVTNPLQLIHESNYDNNKVSFDIQCDPPCVRGQCDFGHSCVCGEGWQGVACDEQADVHHCIPHCGEKDCGPDGCGGSCGSCQTGQHCTVSGACVCTPSCIAKECGPDGCGGVCGECSSLESCNSNQRCMRTCVASCQGRECGPDGCGGTCGGCPEGKHCEENGQCVCTPQCSNEDGSSCGIADGCGGECPCPSAAENCNEETKTCQCVADCQGKGCGDDGCNGSCGECGPEQLCLNDWKCVAEHQKIGSVAMWMTLEALPEEQRDRIWREAMHALLSIPTGSIQINRWEPYVPSSTNRRRMVKVFFTLFDSNERGSRRSGNMLIGMTRNAFAEHGLYSVTVAFLS